VAIEGVVALGVLVTLLVVFLSMARLRLVDADEGYYLFAAKLVREGHRPYADFFFPQMPLLPYAYAAGMAMMGVSWTTGRLLTGVLASLLGTALYLHLLRISGSRRLALFGVLLFATASLSLAWYTVAKTYALTALLLFLAYMALEGGRTSRRPGLIFLSGLLTALAIDARLLAIASLGPFGWTLCRWPPAAGARSRAAGGFVAGLVLGFLPVLWLAALAGPAFWFDNVGFHLRRSDMGFFASLVQKAQVALQLLGLPTVEAGASLQVTLLLAVSLAGRYVSDPVRAQGGLALALAAWLGSVSLLPAPTYLQYFSIIIPFLIVAALASLPEVISLARERFGTAQPRAIRAAGWLAVIAYLAPAPVDAYRYAYSGADVPGIWGPERAQRWTVAQVREVSTTIDRYAEPGAPVLSWWPGYLVESHARAVPGFENQFGLALAGQLTPEERGRYRLVSAQETQAIFGRHETRVIVSGLSNFMLWDAQDLVAAGYDRVTQVGDAEVFVATRP
jgi:hypothetical protein